MASTDLITNAAVLLAEISTGDPATVDDAYDATQPNYGAKIQVGAAVYFRKADGSLWKCRYVRYNSTIAPVEIVGPVYWKDKARTTVTAVGTESVVGHLNSVAGVLLNVNITNGNYGFILVNGLITMVVVAGTAIGDALHGSDTQATAKTTANTAPTNRILGWAESAIDTPVAGSAYVHVEVESL